MPVCPIAAPLLRSVVALLVLVGAVACGKSSPAPARPTHAASASATASADLAPVSGAAPAQQASASRPGRPARGPSPAPVALPAALTVTFAAPQGKDLVLAQGAIGFDRPMVALGAVDTPATTPCATVTPAVPLRWVWLGTDTLGFLSEAPLPLSSRFEVEVHTTCAALDGSRMAAPYRFGFETATPRLLQTWPEATGQIVRGGSVVYLAFDQPVDRDSVVRALTVRAAGKPIAVRAAALELPTKLRNDKWANAAPQQFVAVQLPELPPGERLDVTLGSGVRSLGGPLTAPAQPVGHWNSLGPLRLVSVGCDRQPCAPDDWNVLRLQFSTPLGPQADEQVAKALQVSPALPRHRVHCYQGDSCTVSAVWSEEDAAPELVKPRTTYSIRLAPGVIRDAFDQPLEPSMPLRVQVGPAAPLLELRTSGQVLEAQEGPHKLALYLRNLKHVQVQTRRVQPAELQQARQFVAGEAVPLALDNTITLQPSVKPDQLERRVVVLDQVAEGKRGLFVLQATSPDWLDGDGKPRTLRELYQRTDLHLLARLGERKSLFWVQSFQTGRPVAGVALSLLAPGGQMLWSGISDAQGLAEGPGGLRQEGDRWSANPHAPVLVASLAEDQAALWLDGNTRASADHAEAPWYGDSVDVVRSFLFTDKGIYRLGDPIQLKGITRLLTAAGLELPPEGEPVTVRLLDPVGEVVATAAASVSRHGTFHVQLSTPPWGRRGHYTVEASTLGHKHEAGVEVREYRPPRFVTKLKAPQRHVIAGEPLPIEVEARYWSGGPLAKAPLHIDASGSAWSAYAPEGWQAFGFDDAERLGPSGLSSYTHDAQQQLDKDGQLRTALPTPNQPLQHSVPVDLEVTATDPGGRSTSARAQAWLHPAAALAAVQLPVRVVDVGQSLTALLQAVAPEGAVASGVALTAQWYQISYRQIREVGIGGQVSWRSERVLSAVHRCQATSTAKPSECSFAPASAGNYAVLLEARDANGRVSRASQAAVVVGKDRVVWQQDAERPPLLQADRSQYLPGQVARIAVRNPAPGSVGLLAIERAGMLETRVVELATDATEVEVALTEAHAPNCFVSLTVFAGRRSPAVPGAVDTGAPTLDMGVVRLEVGADAFRLQVAVAATQPKARPGEQVELRVQVKDAAGQPRAAEVALLAVDEAVLSLTGHKTPDPFEALFAPVQDDVRTHALVDALVRGKVGENKGEDGGGGGLSLRADLQDVAFYAPALETGPDGVATVRFKLPGNLTTFRLMAVAVSGPRHVGSGSGQLLVSQPLMLFANWPRRVARGDRFVATALVRNVSDQRIDAVVQLRAAGSLAGSADQQVRLEPGATKELAFPVEATSAGQGTLQLTAKGAGSQDGLQDSVTVVDPAPLQSFVTVGLAEQDVQQAVQRAQHARPDLGGLRVEAQLPGPAALSSSARWLASYPYPCTEQLASRLVAVLALEELEAAANKQAQPSPATSRRSEVTQLIAQLADRQGWQDGALYLWPDAREPDVRATAWALQALSEARRRGHPVPDKLTANMAAWLTGQLAELPQDRPDTLALQARLLAALAAAGKPAPGAAAQLFAHRAQLSTGAQSDLLLALRAEGAAQHGAAATLQTELLGALVVDARSAFLPDTSAAATQGLWPSDVRATGQLLQVLLADASQKALAHKLAGWLLGARQDDHYATTQDGAHALLALLRYWQALPPVQQGQAPAQLQVTLGDTPQTTLTPQGATPALFSIEQAKLPTAQTPLLLRKTGTAPILYTLRYDWAMPLERQTARNAGYFVRKTWYDLQGRPLSGPLRRGQFAVAVVSVLVDRDRRDVAVIDPLPAGVEAEDLTLQTGSKALEQRLEAVRQGLWADGQKALAVQTYTPHPAHSEQAPGEVRWFFDALPPGLHTLTYLVRAASSGTFVAPGTSVSSLYEPEMEGRTAPQRVVVE